ncbi:TRAP transporter substrate-binding protein [Allopusillimonas ginsengisoli]|uniref:TRAP transporter substrate-binding protein n=1 Tax=Allopusillimonas ginsengisoli TaxID=453575 RepID=UPI0010C1AA01|nr:TRAP transporter substrate-binding protein [Allopusillimonas ginsengisoli]
MNFKNIFRTSSVAVALGLTLATVTTTANADIKERTLKFGHLSTADATNGKGAVKFAELVADRSGGKIKVDIYNSGQLGSEVQQIGATQGGTQDFVLLSSSPLTSMVKQLQVLDFPGMVTDKKVAYALLDGPIGTGMLKEFSKKNLVGLAFWENGYRQFTNSKRRIQKVEDFEGLKVRVIQNPIYIDMFEQLDTHAVPMSFNELYTALETKMVDGQDNTISTDDMARFDEVQKYLTMTNHIYNPMVLVGSKKMWDSFSAEEQKIIGDAALEAGAYQRQVNTDTEDSQIKRMQAAGMTVDYFSPEEMIKMRTKMKPVIEKYSKVVGADYVKQVSDEIERISASTAK